MLQTYLSDVSGMMSSSVFGAHLLSMFQNHHLVIIVLCASQSELCANRTHIFILFLGECPHVHLRCPCYLVRVCMRVYKRPNEIERDRATKTLVCECVSDYKCSEVLLFDWLC